MVLIGLLLVALACLVVGLILANAVWLIGSLVASAVAGYLLFKQREQLAVRAGTSKNAAAPKTTPNATRDTAATRPQSLATGTAFTASAPADTAAPTSRPSPRPAPAPATANPEQQVWVVDTLPQFHTEDCAAIQNLDSEAIPYSQAVGDGFTECTVCKPAPSANRTEQVWVVDGRPDYHLEDCRSLKVVTSQQQGEAEQVPRAQAVEDGFSPCPDCRPDGAAPADAAPPTKPAEPAAKPETEAPAEESAATSDTVWVVDGRPRYHLSNCMIIKDQDAEQIPLAQATEDGFMACSMCQPAVQSA